MKLSILENVKLVFENCEELDIPGRYIKRLDTENFSKSGHLWVGHYCETECAKDFRIIIDTEFLQSPFLSFDGKPLENGFTKLERLKAWNDITWVYITVRRSWLFFSWKKTLCYSVSWAGSTSTTHNARQKIKCIENDVEISVTD